MKIVPGDPTALICASGLEQDGALCYPPCQAGFNGIAPVCWQICDGARFDCGVGCAESQSTCAEVTVDMVLTPLIVAVNMVSLGLASAPANAARVVSIGSKTVAYSSKTGFAMARMARAMKRVSATVRKLGKVYKRVEKLVEKLVEAGEVANEVYEASQTYSYLYAQNFAELTSEEINSTLDRKLQAIDAQYIKGLWASVAFQEIEANEKWNIAKTALNMGSIFDPSGVSGVVAAYANPKCLDVVLFPELEALNSPPNAICEDIETAASLASDCEASVPADSVGAKSNDPDGDPLTFSLSGGPFTVAGSPHTVTLTVKDRDSKSDTCTAKITVIDPNEAGVACPTSTSQGTDSGKCSSVVTYPAPVVTDNCQRTSTVALIGGFSSGSVFPRGETLNAYEVTTSEGAKSVCPFKVVVRDTEAPTISCDGLATTLRTEQGLCVANHSFTEPAATDNCVNDFDPELFDAGVYVVQKTGIDQVRGEPFPLGTTTVAYEASDNEGNMADCSFDVVVVDEEIPSISCPNSIVVAAIEFCDKALVEYTIPNASDNCSVKDVVVTKGQASGTYFPLGVTAVTWTVTDGSGNQNSCSFDVTVVEDLDGDKTKDCVDNCPTVYNPDQSDADGDKIGDACDAVLCNNCWRGTSGPCRQSNSVCRGLSRGRCPVGTRPCQTKPLPQCSMCSPGTYGPCQQKNGVCWDKMSTGKCPTGTTECRPQ